MFSTPAFFFYSLTLLLAGVTANEPSPATNNAAEPPPSCTIDECGCDVFWYDYTLFAGRDFDKNHLLEPFSSDVVIQFQQHSRRAWPRWNRYHQLHQVHNRPYHFTYAPGADWPMECHSRLYNLKLNASESSYQVSTDRKIVAGETLFLDCPMEDRNSGWPLESLQTYSMDFLQEHGICLDQVKIPLQGGAVARRSIAAGATVAFAPALHMHRSELLNVTSQRYEPIIDYTYGHPDTDLLLLPYGPIFSSVRPSSQTKPNVELRWDLDEDTPEALFGSKPTELMFALEEQAMLWIKLVATRDITDGEPISIDCGDGWQSGQPRNVPEGFFPPQWLAQETRNTTFPSLLLPKLEPGKVCPVEVDTTGEALATYVHRVGLPSHFADTMEKWADDLGLLDYLERYVDGKTLARGGEERFRFANGTWWTRRFGQTWQSNMHYVATDDDESNEQYFHALGKSGFDTVLKGIGEHFGLNSLTAFYPSFIVVSHCVNAYMHSDSNFEGIYNMILPLSQVDDGQPELILGEDEPGPLHVPYTYERDHGILVGMDGMHGTAPTDYRTGEAHSRRIVMSVYFGDFSDPERLAEFMDEWEDPPYPNYWPGQLEHALGTRVHWKRDDPSVSIGDPLLRAFPLHRPQTRVQ